jgi:hypothetical protein
MNAQTQRKRNVLNSCFMLPPFGSNNPTNSFKLQKALFIGVGILPGRLVFGKSMRQFESCGESLRFMKNFET